MRLCISLSEDYVFSFLAALFYALDHIVCASYYLPVAPILVCAYVYFLVKIISSLSEVTFSFRRVAVSVGSA